MCNVVEMLMSEFKFSQNKTICTVLIKDYHKLLAAFTNQVKRVCKKLYFYRPVNCFISDHRSQK